MVDKELTEMEFAMQKPEEYALYKQKQKEETMVYLLFFGGMFILILLICIIMIYIS